ncbi:hypothetical protein ILUMI_13022 [Ignelater luminosus]|uniref:UDP-glucuronosyltransferase n=1 Tax=Ignelater luminosus TaxID=2038154 RepID=A0A8K0CX08_IGNLU|nr:hypothetical protein ILUMI_13022 [Ignelater luminosus]
MLPPHLSNSFGNLLQTSYMPYFATVFTTKMTLSERVVNFIYTNLDVLYREYISCPTEYNLAKKRFGDDIDTFEEVERNISILLANTDPNLDYSIALPPNIIPVGGLHIKPAKPLPADIEQIMDEAKDGVILFSLGTNIKFSLLTSQQKKALFTALQKFPQTVLWKIEVENPKGLPKNVVVRKWLPQNDILGHPNTKLFISHGGALSTQEAIYHGVPVVTIPFIIDQYISSHRFAAKKFGRHLDHHNLTTENVYDTVKDVLENPIYRNNIQEASSRYRDQPETPLERGVFWIEYILRHKSAKNLVTPARDMPFYKTSNLDVLLVFAIGLFFVYKLILMLILTTVRFVFGYGRSATKTKTE